MVGLVGVVAVAAAALLSWIERRRYQAARTRAVVARIGRALRRAENWDRRN